MLAEAEARAGRALVLTFGGDGTVSEAVRGILASGSTCELGVIPHGTGGDFVRSLRIPARLADAARALRSGATKRIDVGRVRFADGSTRFFVNAASFGLSAEVARRVNASSKSKLSYAEQLVKAAFDFDFPRVELETELGAAERLSITTVSIHNGRFFGGGMEMAPGAELSDGKLQVVVVRKMSSLKLLSRAPPSLSGLPPRARGREARGGRIARGTTRGRGRHPRRGRRRVGRGAPRSVRGRARRAPGAAPKNVA